MCLQSRCGLTWHRTPYDSAIRYRLAKTFRFWNGRAEALTPICPHVYHTTFRRISWKGAPFPLHRATINAAMKYGLTIAAFGNWPFIEIPLDEFHQIKTARSNLLMMLDIEEKFELLVENHAEYESTILGIVQRRMVRGDGTWATAMDDVLLINRRLANVLTAGRLYEDHAKHAISTLYGSDSDACVRVRTALALQYDQALGFRVMEALRNYVQHQALPVAAIRYESERVGRDDRHLILHEARGVRPSPPGPLGTDPPGDQPLTLAQRHLHIHLLARLRTQE